MNRIFSLAVVAAMCDLVSAVHADESSAAGATKKNPLQLLGTATVEKDATGTKTVVAADPALFGRFRCGGFRSGGGYYGYPSYYGNYGVRQYGYGYPGMGTAYYNPVHGNDHTNYGGGYGYHGGGYTQNNYGYGQNYGNYSGNYGGYNNYGNGYGNYGNNYGGYGNYNNGYGNYPNYNNYGYGNNGYNNYGGYAPNYGNNYNNRPQTGRSY